MDIISLRKKGNKAFQSKNLQTAIKYYTQAIEQYEKYAQEHKNDNNDNNENNNTMKNDQDIHLCYGNRSLVYYQLCEFQKSREDAEKSISLEPSYTKAYFHLRQTLVQLGLFDEARQIMERHQNHLSAEKYQELLTRITADEITYQHCISNEEGNRDNSHVRVEFVDHNQGKGVFPHQKSYRRGSPIITETPLVCHQLIDDPCSLKTCNHCLRTIVTEDSIQPHDLKRLFHVLYKPSAKLNAPNPRYCNCCLSLSTNENDNNNSNSNNDNDNNNNNNNNENDINNSKFKSSKAEFYCSEKCQNEAWNSYHQLLCGSKYVTQLYELCRTLQKTNPLIILRSFAILLSQALSYQQKHSNKTVNSLPHSIVTLKPFSNFVGHLEKNQDDDQIFDLIHQIFENLSITSQDSDNLDSEVLKSFCNQCITLENYQFMNGILQRNASRINPVSDWHRFITEFSSPMAQASILASHQCSSISDLFELDYMKSICSTGSGLFAVIDSVNHSCAPNSAVVSCYNDFTLQLTALEDIMPDNGEQITFSYVNENASLANRQEKLQKEYHFQCQCSKCILDSK